MNEIQRHQDVGGGTQMKTKVQDRSLAIALKKMDNLVGELQSQQNEILLHSTSTTTIYVFTIHDFRGLCMRKLDIDKKEAGHLQKLLKAHGFIILVNKSLKLKFKYLPFNKVSEMYRFQERSLWPSRGLLPDNKDYAVYLLQRWKEDNTQFGKKEYRALKHLHVLLSRSWRSVVDRSKANVKVKEARGKPEQVVHELQLKTYWHVHRPLKGTNVLEEDIRKTQKSERKNQQNRTENSETMIRKEIENVKSLLRKQLIKTSKVSSSIMNFVKNNEVSDPFLIPPKSRSGSKSYYSMEWKPSLGSIVKTSQGRAHFRRFLIQEFSVENLDFWMAAKDFKEQPVANLAAKSKELFETYISAEATSPINIDSGIRCGIVEKMKKGTVDRYCFEDARVHIYHLMETDSYKRFLESPFYQTLTDEASTQSTNSFKMK